MVIWSGLGFIIAIVGIAALIVTQMIAESVSGNENYYQENPWLILVAMLVAAALTFLLNQKVLATKSQTVIDKESGQEINLRKAHTLFFIDSKWWPAIFLVIGIAGAFFA